MAESDVDKSLLLFRRQYLQLFEPDFFAWPPQKLLRAADAQVWLYRRLFDEGRTPYLPPGGYQLRVLKGLIARIKKASGSEEGEEVSENLLSHVTALERREADIGSHAAQQDAYVTFSCISESGSISMNAFPEPTITLLERRRLVSGSRVTGFRTWEGSLHLGSYLLTGAGRDLVTGKNILELGAGTGFLSLLCAKHLQARRVTATDGDESVVEALRENISLNELKDGERITARVLRWGEDAPEPWLSQTCQTQPYDVVIGADITYEKVAIKALVATLHHLFDLIPRLRVIISGVVRNADTFESFNNECHDRAFSVQEIPFEAKPMRQQKALFYAAAVPVKILSISRS